MAINRGPWNALIDDDGSNLVGSVWNKDAIKTVILDPTDVEIAAAIAAIPPPPPGITITTGTFTPTDGSGAGLVFVQGGSRYAKVGVLVFVWLTVTYPTTSSGALAIIGGLPFPNGLQAGGFYTTYGIQRSYYIPSETSHVYIYNSTSGAGMTNANMTGAPVVITGFYQAAA
jgi:hypothetical protein